MTKKEALYKISESNEMYLNNDQKLIATKIISNLSENDDIQGYLDFIMKRTGLGFKFDVSPELANGRIAVINEIEKMKINLSEEVVENENILIIGDNYEALKNLKISHYKSIDFIYIDPPYNTESASNDGNNISSKQSSNSKKFIYKDKFGRNGWLNMMRERLIISKQLLKDSGVILCSIDDSEQAYLKILMDEIFGEENFQNLIWKKKSVPSNTEKVIGNLTEYILCYFIDKKNSLVNHRTIEREFKEKDEIGKYKFESIEKTNNGTYFRSTMSYPIIDPLTNTEFLPRCGQRWIFGKETIKKLISENKLFFDYDNKRVKIKKRPEDYEKSKIVYNNIIEEEFNNFIENVGNLTTAKKELEKIMGIPEIFDTPKPVELIMKLLKIFSQKNSIVLDFFAGSGTTGESVWKLNEEDGGTRKFILVTNNENKIGLDITYERLKRIINKNLNVNQFNIRVFNIKHFDISLGTDVKIDSIKNECFKNLKKLNPRYNPRGLDIYYDLSGLNPYNDEQKEQIYSTDESKENNEKR